MVMLTDNTKHLYLANARMILSFHTKESEEYQLASKVRTGKGAMLLKSNILIFLWWHNSKA